MKRLLEALSDDREMPANVLDHHAVTLAAGNGWVYEHQGLVRLTGAGAYHVGKQRKGGQLLPNLDKKPISRIESSWWTTSCSRSAPATTSSTSDATSHSPQITAVKGGIARSRLLFAVLPVPLCVQGRWVVPGTQRWHEPHSLGRVDSLSWWFCLQGR